MIWCMLLALSLVFVLFLIVLASGMVGIEILLLKLGLNLVPRFIILTILTAILSVLLIVTGAYTIHYLLL